MASKMRRASLETIERMVKDVTATQAEAARDRRLSLTMMNCIWARNTDEETAEPVLGEVTGREKENGSSDGLEPGPNPKRNCIKSQASNTHDARRSYRCTGKNPALNKRAVCCYVCSQWVHFWSIFESFSVFDT